MKANLRHLASIACAALALSNVNAATAGNAPIPVATFFKNMDTTGAALSPNGRFVAVRKLSAQGRAMLLVGDVTTRSLTAVANFNNADVHGFYWLSDQRLAFSLINVDHGGSEGQPGLYAIDRDGKNRSILAPTLVRKRSFFESSQVDNKYQSQVSHHGFPFMKREELGVIENIDGDQTLVRMNTRTGHLYSISAPRGTFGWLIDAEGKTRVATARRNGLITTHYRDKDDWRQIDSRNETAEASFDPLLYVDGQLYVRSHNGKDLAGIYRYDLSNNAIVQQPLITAPGFDTDGYFIVSDKKMLGFHFHTDATVTVWFDEQMKAIQQEVDQLLPNMVNTISRGRSSETPFVLIDTYSDVQNHAYILYNTETKKPVLLGESTPDIPAKKMANMAMVRYNARDGQPIPAFLTLPNAAVKKGLPTVVLLGPHPDQRSAFWKWNAEVQFLASRGYAVLQPEPRGVDGFGRAHRQAGGAAQNDIADAVKWAVAEGYTDPARVCIAGTGHGGYTALMGLLKNSDAFKCGISWSSPTKYQDNPDDARLKDIKRPLLLAYGKDDEAVSYKDGLALYQALKTGNPQTLWLEYSSDVDDWKTQKHRIDLWQNIENFLARQIGTGRPE